MYLFIYLFQVQTLRSIYLHMNKEHTERIRSVTRHWGNSAALGPVVQSVVSLTSSLSVISLTVLADLIHNILIFSAEKI